MAAFGRRQGLSGAEPSERNAGSSAWRNEAEREARTVSAPSARSAGALAANAETVLHCLALDGRAADLEKALLRGGDPDGAGQTLYSPPLHLAAARGHADCVRVLLERGANAGAVDHGRRGGRHATHVAIIFGYSNVLALLLDAGASLEAVDAAGATLVGTAAALGSGACVEELLKRGADSRARSGHSGELALHGAARGGHAAVLRTLVEHEVARCSAKELDVVSRRVSAPQVKGSLYSRPAHVARAAGRSDAAAALEAVVRDCTLKIYPPAVAKFDDEGQRMCAPTFCTRCGIVDRDLRGGRANVTHATAQHPAWAAAHQAARRKKRADEKATNVQNAPGELKWRR
ncbi:ankyrin repeat-containing domain protein [Pelagophyceae sp. CCMP2097]|nr:ankyrin repeat-containing domain protein [Pelagophyceae sp. CCMP2097]